jgi:tetratricopeptide (TPR) repeat protein
LKRLLAGRKPDGSPLGAPRNATARLLERIFDASIQELLSHPGASSDHPYRESERELRRMLSASRRVDNSILALLNSQLHAIRMLDRQLGARLTLDEVDVKIRQVTLLLSYSLTPATRQQLAAILAELCTLAGWQTLDLGRLDESWRRYERAKEAANESGDREFKAHAAAEQAFALLDLGETRAATNLLAATHAEARKTTSRLLQAWLAAAYGEALAASGEHSVSLQAFDQALRLLPTEAEDTVGPYVVLDEVHLARWRGHALARIGHTEATEVLTTALRSLDSTFTRAETSLRVDLATSLFQENEHRLAKGQLADARSLADAIGSNRQLRRIDRVSRELRCLAQKSI